MWLRSTGQGFGQVCTAKCGHIVIDSHLVECLTSEPLLTVVSWMVIGQAGVTVLLVL